MTADAGQDRTLAELVKALREARWDDGSCVTQGHAARVRIAETLLASDWLARVKREAAAEAELRVRRFAEAGAITAKALGQKRERTDAD